MKPRLKDNTISSKQIIQRFTYYASDAIPSKVWMDLLGMVREMNYRLRFDEYAFMTLISKILRPDYKI